jgi:hypothetical protein
MERKRTTNNLCYEESHRKTVNLQIGGIRQLIAGLLKIKQAIIELTHQKIVSHIWKEEIISEQWEDGLICTIH